MWPRGLQTGEEEQIKHIYYHIAQKVRAWQKASCCEDRPPTPSKPSDAWVTTMLFDMGQAKAKTWRQIRIENK